MLIASVSPSVKSKIVSPSSIWNVPEPEIGLVVGDGGQILGYTIGNDVSSREIEGANPLYLSQAKVYAGACAIGPAVYVPASEPESFTIEMRILDELGVVAYDGTTSTAEMVRSFGELVEWLTEHVGASEEPRR